MSALSRPHPRPRRLWAGPTILDFRPRGGRPAAGSGIARALDREARGPGRLGCCRRPPDAGGGAGRGHTPQSPAGLGLRASGQFGTAGWALSCEGKRGA